MASSSPLLMTVLGALVVMPLFSMRANGLQAFLRSLAKTRAALEDWRPFWKRWADSGDMSKIQVEWFRKGGPAGNKLSPITIKMRRAGLTKTLRPGAQPFREALPNFYQALKAGNSDNPSLAVSATGPKYVWTKNTLRSTFVDPVMERDRFRIQPMEFDRQHQRTYYKRYITKRGRPRGTFADMLPPERIWDTRSWLISLVWHLQRYFVAVADPRRAAA